MSSPVPVVPIGAAGGSDDLHYERFLRAVVRRQLEDWLPPRPLTLLDLSVQSPQLLRLMIDRGHTVVHAESRTRRLDIAPHHDLGPGRLHTVHGDPRLLDWVGDAAVDGVVAEGGVLSESLAAEVTVEEIHRVLRPGGRLLLSVDSLVAGLSRLADQGRWAELADVPAADVVLIPGDDETVSRCFWPEELHGMLAGCGFEVEWIRPRTVLAEQTVVRALSLDPDQLPSLVATELALSVRRQGESIGGWLVASARKR
ncbi:MAG TPA: methyltransferase domain-containing protein [Mycobacteriales bacterium]|nr:methyltransferase domain-containing protein [Mycobacteriales bacterium]